MLDIRSASVAVLCGIALSLTTVPSALAAPTTKHTKKAPPAVASQYECQKCHMRFSAAQAKKSHFVDAMDGGKLTPVKTAPAGSKKMSSSASKTKS